MKAIILCTVLGFAASVHGAISLVTSNTTAPEVAPDLLGEGASVYVDRAPGHLLVNIPGEIAGAEYIRIGNSDKTAAGYKLAFSLTGLSTVSLMIDDRIAQDPFPDSMTWVSSFNFVDTGLNVDIDEGSDGSINNAFSIYQATFDGGDYVFGEQNAGGGTNMYVVAAAQIPEPSSSVLALSAVGCFLMRRRR